MTERRAAKRQTGSLSRSIPGREAICRWATRTLRNPFLRRIIAQGTRAATGLGGLVAFEGSGLSPHNHQILDIGIAYLIGQLVTAIVEKNIHADKSCPLVSVGKAVVPSSDGFDESRRLLRNAAKKSTPTILGIRPCDGGKHRILADDARPPAVAQGRVVCVQDIAQRQTIMSLTSWQGSSEHHQTAHG
jgi:hypothetical protein